MKNKKKENKPKPNVTLAQAQEMARGNTLPSLGEYLGRQRKLEGLFEISYSAGTTKVTVTSYGMALAQELWEVIEPVLQKHK